MKLTEAEKKRRARIATDLAKAGQILRIYRQNGLADRVDKIANDIYTGQLTERPVQ